MQTYPPVALALAMLILSASVTHAALPPKRSTSYDGAGKINYGTSLNYDSSVAMTIEAWVYRRNANNCETIASRNFTDSYWFGFCARPRFYRSGGTHADATVDVPACRWTHVAVSYDGSQARFYVDGQPAGVAALANGGAGRTQTLWLGGDPGGYNFNGLLDEVRIWMRARTQAEIQADMWREINTAPDLAFVSHTGGQDGPHSSLQVFGILPRDLVVPHSALPISVDGNVNPSVEYAGAEQAVIRYRDGVTVCDTVAYLMYRDDALANDHTLYIGVTGLRQVAPGWNRHDSCFGVGIDPDYSRDAAGQPGDFRIRGWLDASTPTWGHGDGAGNFGISPSTTLWQVAYAYCNGDINPPCMEMRIDQALLGSFAEADGISLGHFYTDAARTTFLAPGDAVAGSPATWARLTYGEVSADLPAITTQPQSQNVAEGDPVTFSVRAIGAAPLAYQWFKNGQALAGLTVLEFTLPKASQSDAGTYFCRVANAYGQTDSSNAILTVKAPVGKATWLGIPLLPLGQAVIEGRTDGSLRLAGLGGSIADGLRLDSGEVAGMRVDFDQAQAAGSLTPGSEFRVIALGAGSAPMAVLRMVRNSSSATLEVIPDFGGLNSSTFGIRLYSGSQVIFESHNRTAPPPSQFPISNQIFATATPQAIRISNRPAVGPVFEYSFVRTSYVQVFENANGASYFPDRMEIFADAPGAIQPATLSGLDLRFSGVNERIITGVALMKFGQEFRASRGVALTGVGDSLAYMDVNVPALTNPPPPMAPVVWNIVNPLGYFGDFVAGNPSGYKGYWEGMNPLGTAGQWDLKVDLTDNASLPLGFPGYRPGKSSAELTLASIPSAPPAPPPFPDGAKLRVVAGGVAEPDPGALTVEMGALVFEGKAGRVELGAEFKSPTGPLRQRLEVKMTDGAVQTFTGIEEELRVSWDQAAGMPTGAVFTAIGPDGALTMGIRVDRPGPPTIHLPDGADVQAISMTWRAEGGQTWTPGSLRGLVLVGSNAPDVSITGLTTSANNPTPASFFADHQVSVLGNATFRTDAFGSLALSGLTQSGEDGVAIKGFPVTVADAAWPSGPGLKLNPGYLPFWPQGYPPKGTRFDLRMLSEGKSVPNAVMAGQSINPGSAIFLGFQFPNLNGTNHTLRVFRGNSVVFNRSGRRNEAPTEQGNFVPDSIPDEVVARVVNGRFTWVLTWNRVIAISIYNQPFANPFLGDRAEIMADDGTAYPTGENTLELRAGSIGTLRLLNLGNRSAPRIPALNLGLGAERLNLNWGEVVSGFPRLQIAPEVTGPWQNFGLGELLSDGTRRFLLEPSGLKGFTRLVTRPATEGCLSFSTETPGNHSNPADFAGWKFERFDPNDIHTPFNEVSEVDGYRGLRFNGRLDIELPTAAAGVDLVFQRSGAALTIIAYDDAGEIARKVVQPGLSGGGAEAETVEAPTRRPARRLRLIGRDGPVDLRELCLRAFPFYDVAQARSCLPLRTAALGPTPEPWIHGDLTISAHTADGASPPTGLVSLPPNSLIAGYDVAYQAELKFAHACPWVEIEFISSSGSIDFQAYDDQGTALPPYHLDRVSSSYGETAVFTGNPRPIARVMVTSPAGQTRLMKICGGPAPVFFCREVGDITVRPTRNPQPAGDMMWTFYDAAHVLASSMLRTNATEVGLDLTPETVIDFASDQLSVELCVVVDAGGATISADAMTAGGNTVTSLPSTSYAAGVRTLSLVDTCNCGVGASIRRVRVRVTAGNAILTRVCTPFKTER